MSGYVNHSQTLTGFCPRKFKICGNLMLATSETSLARPSLERSNRPSVRARVLPQMPHPIKYRSMRLVPVAAHTHFHQQRHVQIRCATHVNADVLADLLDQILAHFQHQFVVNLQNHSGIKT